MSDEIIPGLNEADLFDESLLDDFKDPPPKRPDGFGITSQELAKAKGYNEHKAKRILEQKVTDGEYKKILLSYRFHHMYIYFKGKLHPDL